MSSEELLEAEGDANPVETRVIDLTLFLFPKLRGMTIRPVRPEQKGVFTTFLTGEEMIVPVLASFISDKFNNGGREDEGAHDTLQEDAGGRSYSGRRCWD